MLNRYEDGNIYIGNHRDNRENRVRTTDLSLLDLIPAKVIASISVGAPRTFVMTYAPPANAPAESGDDSGLRSKKWQLENGSLVVMQGETQRYWKHAIVRLPSL